MRLGWSDKPVFRAASWTFSAWKCGVIKGKLAVGRQYFVMAMVAIKGIGMGEDDFHAARL